MKGRLQIPHAKTPGSSGQRQEQRIPGQRHTSRQERQDRQVSARNSGFQGCSAAFVVAPGRSARASSPALPGVASALRALESAGTPGRESARATGHADYQAGTGILSNLEQSVSESNLIHQPGQGTGICKQQRQGFSESHSKHQPAPVRSHRGQGVRYRGKRSSLCPPSPEGVSCLRTAVADKP
jgi:hypothetical protein